MSFLSPLFLYALPLISVPLVIHLLNKRRQKVILWGAMQFLMKAVTRQSRIWRIKDLLLLLLRTFVLLFFIMALAMPLIKTTLFGGTGNRDVTLIFDVSMSAGALTGQESVFERELQAAQDLIGRLKKGDTLRVLLASSAPEWMTQSRLPVSDALKDETMARLRRTVPTLAATDVLRCLQLAADDEPKNRTSEWIIAVLTDKQAYGWRPQDSTGWATFKEKCDSLQVKPILNVVSFMPDSADSQNLSVESMNSSSAIAAVGDTIVLTAVIRNNGSIPSPAGTIDWEDNGRPIGVTPFGDLNPGETTTVSMQYSFPSKAVSTLVCRINALDDLQADNEGTVVVEVVDKIPVLVVEGPIPPGQSGAGVQYFIAALGSTFSDAPREWESMFAPKRIDSLGFQSENLFDYACVVLSDVPQLSPTLVASLEAYVEKGGGLWIALGPNTDLTSFNTWFYNREKGLSPVTAETATGNADNFDKYEEIHPPSPQHRATALLADTERLDVDQARVYMRYPILGKDLGFDNTLLQTNTGAPLAAEKFLGRGRVIVQALPLDVQWSNLPLCKFYVVMACEWLSYLSESSTTQRNLRPGESLNVVFPVAGFDEKARVVTPSGREVPIVGAVRDNRLTYKYGNTSTPGLYRIVAVKDAGNEISIPFFITRDPKESDLTRVNEEDTANLLSFGGMSFVEDALKTGSTNIKQDSQEPIWTWLLISLIIFMILELLLAGHLTRRRTVQPERATVGRPI